MHAVPPEGLAPGPVADLRPIASASTCATRLATRVLWALLVSATLMGLDAALRSAVPSQALAAWPERVPVPQGRLGVLGQGHMPMPPATPSAHASTLLAMPDSDPVALWAFWFAGSRESGPDVQIVASAFSRHQQQWSPAQAVVNRHVSAAELGYGVRRLGNPVAWRDAQGRINLFVVATGLGGWAAGRIKQMRQIEVGQDPEALKFETVRVLPLSWLWNISHLVRAMPLALADGGMVLPVYFELGKKYPVALRFDAQGEFLGMVRMSRQADRLQPTLLMRSATDWVALMRDNSPARQLHAAQTLDGGVHWHDLPDPGLPNPDAAVAGLALAPSRLYLAHNPRAESRAVLALSESVDGLSWRPVLTLAQGQGQGRDEYSYPSMTWADNSLWVSYTDQRQRIAWQRLGFIQESSP